MKRRKAPVPVEIPEIVQTPVITFQGNCDKCRFLAPNNKLKGYWEGFCGQGNGLVRDTNSCGKWQVKNR